MDGLFRSKLHFNYKAWPSLTLLVLILPLLLFHWFHHLVAILSSGNSTPVLPRNTLPLLLSVHSLRGAPVPGVDMQYKSGPHIHLAITIGLGLAYSTIRINELHSHEWKVPHKVTHFSFLLDLGSTQRQEMERDWFWLYHFNLQPRNTPNRSLPKSSTVQVCDPINYPQQSASSELVVHHLHWCECR